MATTRIRQQATKLLYVFVLLSLMTSNLGLLSSAKAQDASPETPTETPTSTDTPAPNIEATSETPADTLTPSTTETPTPNTPNPVGYLEYTIPYLGLTFSFPSNWSLQPLPYMDFGFRINSPNIVVDPLGRPTSGGYLGATVAVALQEDWNEFVSNNPGEPINIGDYQGVKLSGIESEISDYVEWHFYAYNRHHILRFVSSIGDFDQLFSIASEMVTNVALTGIYEPEPFPSSQGQLGELAWNFSSIKHGFIYGPGRIIADYDAPSHTGNMNYGLDICAGQNCFASVYNDIVLAPTDIKLVWSMYGNRMTSGPYDYHIFEITYDFGGRLCLGMGHFKITIQSFTLGKTMPRGAQIGRIINYTPDVNHIHMSLYTVPMSQGCEVPANRIAVPFDSKNLDLRGQSLDGEDYRINNHYKGTAVTSTNAPMCAIPTNLEAASQDTEFEVTAMADDGCDGGGLPPIGTIDSATFIKHVTLPDGTVVSPGQGLVKTWRVKNTGTSTWGGGYQLVFTGGEQMGAPNAVNVPVTAPGQEADISVNITAPSGGGSHQGNWRLRNPQGTYFGDELWVEITVQDDSNPPPPSADFKLTCLNCPATVPPGQTFRPTIRATVGNGQLLESRGDLLRNTDGNLYGAWPHIAVVGAVNQGGVYNFTFYENNPITAPDSEGTYQTKWQLWQDGRYVGPELTIEFQVSSSGGGTNHPPNAPSLTGPGDWAVYYGNTGINLQAQNNGDPDGDTITHYYFEIFESHDIPNSGWITSNSWSPQGLGWNGYQWHVKVRDSRGAESGWSNTWHFNLINNEPEIYNFHSETCRASWGGSEKICFCAQTNAGTLQLQVNMATDGSGNGEWRVLNELGVPNYDCNTDNDRPPNWGQLEAESGTHLVRLYARREGGWGNAAKQDITVYLPPERRPNNPSLLQPTNQAYLNSLAIHFNWNESLRTTGYHLEVSTDSSFGTLLIDKQFSANTTEYDRTLPTDYETVYWRVTATGPYGTNESTNRFYTDINPPTSAVAALPPVTTDTKFSVNWSGSDARSGLHWYHVQVRDGNRSDSEWVDWLVNTTKTAELFSGQSGHTYYFRSRAMDKVGNWEDWPTGDGDTLTLVDPSSVPPTIWWDNAYAAKRNLIILNNDSNNIPIHYPMHIHFDSSTSPTAAQIYNVSLSSTKGGDVRIVYNNQTELERFVQRFTSSQIDLWFPLYAVLGGGQTDNSSYQIYYGYAGATSPTVDINDIFLPVADANTMGLWHFQNGAGSTVTDTSGRGHHGTFSSPGWNDGWLGWAGAFNGSSSYVNAGNSNDFNIGGGPMTIEAWVYLIQRNNDYPIIAGKWDNFGNGSYFVRFNNQNQIQWYMRGNFNSEVGTPGDGLLLNTWYHVAVTYDGNTTMKIFINGQERAKITNHGGAHNSALPFMIGWATGYNDCYFQGLIQHVRISNVERTNFEYANITNAPSVAAGATITPPIPGSPDLAVLDLISYPNPGGGVVVQANIQNQGSANTLNGFYTDLYVDHLPTGGGDYTGSLRFWVNDPIAAGATVTLTTVITNLSSLSGMDTHLLAPASESNATLYAQTDSSGVVSEPDESNNIYSAGTEICIATADAYEGDDTAGTASNISLEQTQTHNFNHSGDQDWIKFSAQEGESYTLRTLNLGVSADTYLYLYNTDGITLLASNDDYGGTLTSRIDWEAAATGTYYIMVQHWNPNAGGCGTTYDLSVNRTQEEKKLFLPLITR